MQNPILVSVEKINEQLLEELESKKTGLELSYFANPLNLATDTLQTEIQRHKNLLKGFTQPKSMHGSFYDLNVIARDPKIVEVCRFRINESIEIAQELDMKHIVFHTNYIHSQKENYKTFWIEQQVLFWKQFIPVLSHSGITIYLENTREEDASYLTAIIDRLASPFIKICYDTGHSNCFTQSKIPPVEWAKHYQERMAYIHLHSNHGLQDEHITFNHGNVNFTGFFEEITQRKKLPWIIIEVKTREDYLESWQQLQKL